MIFILDNDLRLCAQALDDKSLDSMIHDIAQVLCNVHKEGGRRVYDKFLDTIPLPYKNKYLNTWGKWARECRANYLYLVELESILLEEFNFRQLPNKKMYLKYLRIVIWVRDNVPDLRDCAAITNSCRVKDCDNITGLPLVIPKKYIVATRFILMDYSQENAARRILTIESYRNFYRGKYIVRCNKAFLKIGSHRDVIWTNRDKPDWLKL